MNLFFASRRLKYFLLARHRRGHGIHSPFVFNLFSEIFLNETDPGIVKSMVDHKYPFRNLSDISVCYGSEWDMPWRARGGNKYYRMLARIAGRVKGLPVLQLGNDTCMTSVALALGAAGWRVVQGDDYERLGQITGESGEIGLAMISADRCREKLLYCFDTVAGVATEETIIVIGGIHKSAKIEDDWHKMINDNRVSVSIDLLRYGVLFFRQGMSKQDFLIRY